MKHTQGKLILKPIDSWPFGFNVVDDSGDIVLHENATCCSTEQKTRQQHENGVGFTKGTERDEAVKTIAAQKEKLRRIVACWNAAVGISTEEIEAAACGGLLNTFEGLIRERGE